MSATCWRVLRPGALTTVQDRGRHGLRHLGVGRAGALDPELAALANRLAGNPADAAVLELTLSGPTLALPAPARIALCGAEVDARFEGEDGIAQAVPGGRPVTLPAGTLHLGRMRRGLRAWLAVAGGFDVPRVLGSRSTDLRGGFGGLDGRALREGDLLPVAGGMGGCPEIEQTRSGCPEHPPSKHPQESGCPEHHAEHHEHHSPAMRAPRWWIDPAHDPSEGTAPRAPIRYLPSPLARDAGLVEALTQRVWTVDPHSDRQGLRCAGEALAAALPEQISAPVAPGTLQLPPNGCPVVLLADAQTIGGYPRLGHVLAADLSRLAQLRAGDALCFAAVSADEARAIRQQQAGRMARLEWAIDRALGEDAVR